jgi:hypothetical protein
MIGISARLRCHSTWPVTYDSSLQGGIIAVRNTSPASDIFVVHNCHVHHSDDCETRPMLSDILRCPFPFVSPRRWPCAESRTGPVSNVGRGASFYFSFSFHCALCSAREREDPRGRGKPREGQLNGGCLVSTTMKTACLFLFLRGEYMMDGIRKACLNLSRRKEPAKRI